MTTEPATVTSLRDRLLAARPDIFSVNTKYAPKLTFADRCICLGFFKMGVAVPVLAATFGINRATVRYITNPSSRFYKSVRQRWTELGADAFHEQFTASELGKEWEAKLIRAKSSTEAKVPEDTLKAMTTEKLTAPDPRAKQKQGKHTLSFGGKTYVVTFMWFDTIPEDYVEDEELQPRLPGWYAAVSGKDQEPLNGLNADRFTSTSALKGFLAMVEGEEV